MMWVIKYRIRIIEIKKKKTMNRNYSTSKFSFKESVLSTEDNFCPPLEKSQREYQQLMQENQWLKDQLTLKYSMLSQRTAEDT